MHLLQNLKQKSVARKSMILLAAITLGTAVAKGALAAGHGGGAGIGGGSSGGSSGGRVGGGFGGGGLAGGHASAGFGGGGFPTGHPGSGFVGGRMGGDHLGGHGDAYLGNRGESDFHGPRMGGGEFHGPRVGGGVHDRDHHFRERFVVVPGYDDYYDNYDYGLGDYAGDSACFQYRHVHTTAGWQWRQVWVCN
jgi:hypothetical protein